MFALPANVSEAIDNECCRCPYGVGMEALCEAQESEEQEGNAGQAEGVRSDANWRLLEPGPQGYPKSGAGPS